MARKLFSSSEIKNADKGHVTARFGTFGVRDLDGDVIEKGAIGVQEVQVSQFGHASWGGGLPVGRGATREDGDEMLADLEFFMSTTHGRDHFETVKQLGDLGEWSFSFNIEEERAPTGEERQLGIVRVLEKLEVFEISPVLRGAGVDTATLDAKCNACAGKAAMAAGSIPSLDELRRARRFVEVGRSRLAAVVPPPTFEIEELATFGVAVAHRLAGLPRGYSPPELAFFAPDGVRNAFMFSGSHVVHLSKDLRDQQLCASVLHECEHIAQDARGALRAPSAECDAAAFAAKWSRAVFGAWRWTEGSSVRVLLRTGLPPFRDIPRGHVVLAEGRLFNHNSRNRGPSWHRVA